MVGVVKISYVVSDVHTSISELCFLVSISSWSLLCALIISSINSNLGMTSNGTESYLYTIALNIMLCSSITALHINDIV